MCHPHETREWVALREELEEVEPESTEAEPPKIDAEPEPEADHELPPIQPSD